MVKSISAFWRTQSNYLAGHPVVECDVTENDHDTNRAAAQASHGVSGFWRRSKETGGHRLSHARSLERAVTDMFVLRPDRSRDRTISTADTSSTPNVVRRLPRLSRHITIGRNSRFSNLSARDRRILGGIEYRSLQLLLKIVSSKVWHIPRNPRFPLMNSYSLLLWHSHLWCHMPCPMDTQSR
jgi:hypothetical protein